MNERLRMIDLHTVNIALGNVLPSSARYVIVVWGDGSKSCISSNEMDETVVQRMLESAASVVGSSTDPSIIPDEPMGHA